MSRVRARTRTRIIAISRDCNPRRTLSARLSIRRVYTHTCTQRDDFLAKNRFRVDIYTHTRESSCCLLFNYVHFLGISHLNVHSPARAKGSRVYISPLILSKPHRGTIFDEDAFRGRIWRTRASDAMDITAYAAFSFSGTVYLYSER